MNTFLAEKLSLAYTSERIIDGLDLEIPVGQVTALVGPNGCGKSTLLRGLARLLKPQGGSVLLDGAAIHSLPTKQLAREIGILPQSPVAPEGLTVRELVAQGRYPHQHWFQQWSPRTSRPYSRRCSSPSCSRWPSAAWIRFPAASASGPGSP